MRIGVTGARGRLGSALVALGCLPITSDVTRFSDLEREIRILAPDCIINTASVTDVDGCEDPAIFKRAYSTAVLGNKFLQDSSVPVIYLSTDYIFDGRRGPYLEDARPNPIQGYGWAKWAGEETLRFLKRPGDTIVRTTGLFGAVTPRVDFVKQVVDTLRRGEVMEATTEVIANQTYIPHLAEALIALARLSDRPAVVNISGLDRMSRYEFALMIASVYDLDKEKIHPTKHVPNWIAKRPKKGGFRLGLARRLGIPLYPVVEGLKSFRQVQEGVVA